MRFKYSIILFLALINLPGSGQSVNPIQRYILFHGIVMDAVSQVPIINPGYRINENLSGTGGADGKFSFYVSRGDTVVFTSMGYRLTTLFVSDSLRVKEYVAGVFMHTDTISIGEVVIVPRPGDLKSEIMKMKPEYNQELSNAKDNISMSVYQGLNNTNTLGDPISNYELIKQKQKIDAYEKGGIPSDRIVGISPLLLLPAAYLLMNGIPSKPAPPSPRISNKELEQIQKIHNDLIYKKKE
jgi:hypothetical protein